MTLAQTLLPEFDQEMAATRRCLERIPAERLDWQPHEKSMTLAGLATHLSNIPRWALATLKEDEFDFAPGGEVMREEAITSVDQALEHFDQMTAATRAALEETGDDRMQATWTLKSNGETIFAMPRIAVLRSMILNHMIHHRGQLSVYLRLAGARVPQVYGPTADEE